MPFDTNPKFGEDQSFSEGARRVTDLLWETTGGNPSAFPQSYLETLRYEFSDGRVSMLELIDRVDLGPDASYEDYCEVVDTLMSVDPDQWPEPDSVLEVQSKYLAHEVEPEFDFNEFDFAEEDDSSAAMGKKMETFLKKVIGTVYLDGVTKVVDKDGSEPSEDNNFLMSDDGKTFSGVFFGRGGGTQVKKFPFKISESAGKWQITY